MEYVEPIRDIKKLNQMKAYLRQRNHRDYFLFLLGLNTGLRINDILKLRVRDIKDYKIRIQENKTRKPYRIELFKLKDEIDNFVQFKSDDEYLFKSRQSDKPITRTQAYRIINGAADMVGLSNIGCHSMRKTFGYHHYKQHRNIAVLMSIFNHSSENITMRYLGVANDEINQTLDEFIL